ncbi:Clp protease N-terminal domain-containing protein [Streptomyces sp. NPDC002793]|uniref:Clp protease N-terminal domain-containing protein n=1 Tax=Streptomyces sp. NPDC002793 TaxID=3154432 RepID=UPI003332A192
MNAIMESDWNVVGILGAARGAQGAADGDAIGTEHLLAGIVTAKGAAPEALAGAGATKTVLVAVLRDRTDRDSAWGGTDDNEGSVAAKDVLGEDGDERGRFTGAAARALTAAMGQARQEGAAKFGAVHLLRGLLAEDNRAVETLGTCGISPRAVLARLEGDTGAEGEEDGLFPLLHPTREVLLGRSQYRQMPFWKRWLVKRMGINWASHPAWWVRMETYEQARRLGDRAVGSEHVLLAILATHEVALRYPHLLRQGAPAPDTRYEGGERLARLGIDYASVRTELTGGRVRLAADARPVEQYVDETAGPGGAPAAGAGSESRTDPGTGPLVEILLGEETRARRLIDAMTTGPRG